MITSRTTPLRADTRRADTRRPDTSRSPARSAALVAVGLLTAVGLTGCGLEFIPDAGQEKSAEKAPDRTPSTDRTPEEPDASGSPAAEGGTGGEAPGRADLAAAVERMVSCPGGAIDIADVGSVLQLDSDCPSVTVSGSGTVVLAENVDALTVTGIGVTVYVRQLGSASVSGSGNIVTWESGSPVIDNVGTGNTLLPAN